MLYVTTNWQKIDENHRSEANWGWMTRLDRNFDKHKEIHVRRKTHVRLSSKSKPLWGGGRRWFIHSIAPPSRFRRLWKQTFIDTPLFYNIQCIYLWTYIRERERERVFFLILICILLKLPFMYSIENSQGMQRCHDLA